MADGEKIDIVKAVTSPFTGIYWVKVIMMGFGLCFLLFVGYCVYNTLHPKPQQVQNSTTTVTGQPGSHITVEGPKQEVKDTSHFSIGPFVGGNTDGEVFGGLVVLYNF